MKMTVITVHRHLHIPRFFLFLQRKYNSFPSLHPVFIPYLLDNDALSSLQTLFLILVHLLLFDTPPQAHNTLLCHHSQNRNTVDRTNRSTFVSYLAANAVYFNRGVLELIRTGWAFINLGEFTNFTLVEHLTSPILQYSLIVIGTLSNMTKWPDVAQLLYASQRTLAYLCVAKTQCEGCTYFNASASIQLPELTSGFRVWISVVGIRCGGRRGFF